MTVYLRAPDKKAEDATWHWAAGCQHHRRLTKRPKAIRKEIEGGRPATGELCNTCLALEADDAE